MFVRERAWCGSPHLGFPHLGSSLQVLNLSRLPGLPLLSSPSVPLLPGAGDGVSLAIPRPYYYCIEYPTALCIIGGEKEKRNDVLSNF